MSLHYTLHFNDTTLFWYRQTLLLGTHTIAFLTSQTSPSFTLKILKVSVRFPELFKVKRRQPFHIFLEAFQVESSTFIDITCSTEGECNQYT